MISILVYLHIAKRHIYYVAQNAFHNSEMYAHTEIEIDYERQIYLNYTLFKLFKELQNLLDFITHRHFSCISPLTRCYEK